MIVTELHKNKCVQKCSLQPNKIFFFFKDTNQLYYQVYTCYQSFQPPPFAIEETYLMVKRIMLYLPLPPQADLLTKPVALGSGSEGKIYNHTLSQDN